MKYLPDILLKSRISSRIKKIKEGDLIEREDFINDYIPFIIKTVSNKTNRYIESENSDEYIIGLEAFNEAIDKYEFSKGNFISFASLVIKSRIIDFMRKQAREGKTVSIDQILEKEAITVWIDCGTQDFTESLELKSEIEEFKKNLEKFNITLEDLVAESPKHNNTRDTALLIARYVHDNNDIKEELIKKKRLPSSRIIKDLGISKKTLTRSRKFIIATVIILDSKLDIIKDYINHIEGGATDDIQRANNFLRKELCNSHNK